MMLLVFAWSLKLLYGSLQANCRLVRVTLAIVSVGWVVISVPTLTLPSTARLLTQVARLPETVTDAPFGSGWLNRTNLSPGTKLFGPRFLRVRVPPAAFRASVPLTLTESFAGEAN